jgi:hypothetical protein
LRQALVQTFPKAGIGAWLSFYNQERQHQSLGYRTPRQAYEAECPWICGRSASPTGCAFAHIPTGTAAQPQTTALMLTREKIEAMS